MNARIVAWPSGKKHGITELHPDVVSYVSHATQQRLQNLVEKISETAQQKNFSYKVTCSPWLVPRPVPLPARPSFPTELPRGRSTGPHGAPG